MAKPITPFSISAPGYFGLNTVDSPVDLDSKFALEANNCVIDKSGRIATRKGWIKGHLSNADLGSASVECIGELIQNDGTATLLCAGNGKLFKRVISTTTTLVNLTYGGGGVAPTISANNWKFCQLNGIAMFWQRGHDPLIYDPAVSTTTYRRLNEKAGTAGTVYQCNEAISAYGRVWAADTSSDKQTVVFSDLLTPHIWTGGTAGSLDLRQVWPSGGDEIVGLAAHNEFLFIFGKWQIIVYKGATDPATMELSDTIVGIGCIARDTIQNSGDDVLFLSDSGVQSLRRTIQEKSAPIVKFSKNVSDDLQEALDQEAVASIKSGYSAVNRFYLLTLPSIQRTYCFDTRQALQDGSSRVTVWNGVTSKAFYETADRDFFMGRAGYCGLYSGYLDDTAEYRMTYYTTWIDFGNPIEISILKKIFMDIIGGRNQTLIIKWGFDFVPAQFSETVALPSTASSIAEYNISEYNEAEYSGVLGVNRISVNTAGTGRVIQIGLEGQIIGYPISVQKMDIFTKAGRI